VDDLIDYIKSMRKKLGDSPYAELIMVEVTNIASDNWIQNGVPNLSKEQFNKVILRVISKGTTLN
jgi:hypothetical protein